jgi:hypothetical protein
VISAAVLALCLARVAPEVSDDLDVADPAETADTPDESVPEQPEPSPTVEAPAPLGPSAPPGALETETTELADAEARRDNALEHLSRAQALEAAGDLESAEAEVSVAVALDPTDATSYLARAQIRMQMAQHVGDDDDPAYLRRRSALLRQAASDVSSYLEHAELSPDSRQWFEARRDGLLRDAEALEPAPVAEPAPTVAAAEPIIPTAPVVVAPRSVRRTGRTAAWVSTCAVLGATAAGLAATSLRIQQSCSAEGLCAVRWQMRPALLAPAMALTALGTSAIVLGVASAPAMARPRVRSIVGTTTLAVGGAATVVGAVTASLARARWTSPLSPSADAPLRTTQSLANASMASFAVALPLLSAGLTAWLQSRRRQPDRDSIARRGRHSASR